MIPVQSEELSALLDGELDPGRAREIQVQIATDPALRREFEELSAADARWLAAAGSAAFTSKVQMPVQVDAQAGGDAGWLPALAVAISILIIARIVLKLAGSDAWTFGLPAISLALLLGGVIGLVRMEQRGTAETAS